MSADLPTGVLSQQLGDRIAGRRVRAALFTTFAFDPGFFELNVLPLLFSIPFRQADKVKRIQLEDALRDVAHIAVYYDQTALSRDAMPAQLDYRRIDVRRRTGVFHPKVVCLLLENPNEGDDTGEVGVASQSLLVGVMSANLTRAGWWENVECAHFEEIADKDQSTRRVPFRSDLLRLLRHVRDTAGPGEDQSALESLRTFLLTRTQKREFANVTSQRYWFTRIFCGQRAFSSWLTELKLHREQWNLEVVSPYFPRVGIKPLEDLIEALEPRRVRIHLPTDADGTVLIAPETYQAVEELGARWSKLPAELVQRGRGADAERQAPRFVHAKMYRLWAKNAGEVLITGSVNLTDAAHSRDKAGNVEAAWLVDTTDCWPQRWWLQPIEHEPTRFVSATATEETEYRDDGMDFSLRFDWGEHRLDYRFREPAPAKVALETTGGIRLGEIEAVPTAQDWLPAATELSNALQQHLAASSFVVGRARNREWTILVREENVAHRPSLLSRLTPEEILEYWSLLTAEQKAAFLEPRVEAQLEGLGLVVDRLQTSRTLFDRFAGVFHAFGCLKRFVDQALDEKRPSDAEARLFGAKYDSLPNLLQMELDHEEDTPRDPVVRYVTFLCARQLYDQIEEQQSAFVAECGTRTRHLDALLQRIPEVRDAMQLPDAESRDFVEWYEQAFLGSADAT